MASAPADRRLALLSQQLATVIADAPQPATPAGAMGRADYNTMYRESIIDPERFWTRAADAIDWDVPCAICLPFFFLSLHLLFVRRS